MNRDKKFGIQAFIFRKTPRFRGDHYWSLPQTVQYLRQHELEPIKPMHETQNFYRYRLMDPRLFKKMYTFDRGDGTLMIVGELS